MSEDLSAVLARLETKLDHALSQTVDHETRLRALESRIWQAVGAASAISAGLATGAMTFIR